MKHLVDLPGLEIAARVVAIAGLIATCNNENESIVVPAVSV